MHPKKKMKEKVSLLTKKHFVMRLVTSGELQTSLTRAGVWGCRRALTFNAIRQMKWKKEERNQSCKNLDNGTEEENNFWE